MRDVRAVGLAGLILTIGACSPTGERPGEEQRTSERPAVGRPATDPHTVAMAGPLSARLEPDSTRRGWVVLRLENTSDETVRFLDAPEGTAAVSSFWQVILEKDGERRESSIAFYSPLGIPTLVELEPGEVYQRDFQLAAYLFGAEKLEGPYRIAVRYRVEEGAGERWGAWVAPADSDSTGSDPSDSTPSEVSRPDLQLGFETPFLEIEMLPQAIQR